MPMTIDRAAWPVAAVGIAALALAGFQPSGPVTPGRFTADPALGGTSFGVAVWHRQSPTSPLSKVKLGLGLTLSLKEERKRQPDMIRSCVVR